MSVFLRHVVSGSYYRGSQGWVNDSGGALDLETVERAVEAGRQADLEGLEVIAWFDHLKWEWVFPLRLNGTKRANARPVGAAWVETAPGWLSPASAGSANNL